MKDLELRVTPIYDVFLLSRGAESILGLISGLTKVIDFFIASRSISDWA